MATGLGACNTNPHVPDIAAPAAVPSSTSTKTTGYHALQHAGIQLPQTVSLSYAHPLSFNSTQHLVLWDVNQAVKAELNASYEKTSAATPDLKRYWTGPGYAAAHDWATAWISAEEQPVGRVVITGTEVTSLTSAQSTVTYCENLSMVYRGMVRTHAIKGRVQPEHTNGTFVTLTLVPTLTKDGWQVSQEQTVGLAPACPPDGERLPSAPPPK